RSTACRRTSTPSSRSRPGLSVRAFIDQKASRSRALVVKTVTASPPAARRRLRRGKNAPEPPPARGGAPPEEGPPPPAPPPPPPQPSPTRGREKKRTPLPSPGGSDTMHKRPADHDPSPPRSMPAREDRDDSRLEAGRRRAAIRHPRRRRPRPQAQGRRHPRLRL